MPRKRRRSTRSDPPKLPAYRLHRASGQAVVTLCRHDFYLGEYGTPQSLREYQRILAEWERAGKKRLPARTPDNLKVAELVARHYTAHQEVLSRGELRNFRAACRPLVHLYGHTDLADFGPVALKIVRDRLIARGYVRRTVNGYVSRIRAVFGWGVSEELIPVELHQALQTVAGLRKGRSPCPEGHKVRPVPAGAIEAVRPFVQPAVWAMVRLQALTGMRPGEAVIMRRADVDTGGEVWLYTPTDHKNDWREDDDGRTIDLGPKAQEVLRPFLAAELDRYLFSPAESMRAYRAELIAERVARGGVGNHKRRRRRKRRVAGDRYTVDSYRRAITRGCRRAGIAPWHPHQLRHTFGTAVRRRYGAEAARVAMGHASLSAAEIYAERDRALARRIALEVG